MLIAQVHFRCLAFSVGQFGEQACRKPCHKKADLGDGVYVCGLTGGLFWASDTNHPTHAHLPNTFKMDVSLFLEIVWCMNFVALAFDKPFP